MSARWARIGVAETTRTARVLARRSGPVAVVVVLVALLAVPGAVLAASREIGPAERSTGAPPTPPPPSGTVSFLSIGPDGTPARLPCGKTVAVRYDPSGSPYDAEDDLRWALRNLQDAIHRPFELGGSGSDSSPQITVTWVPSAGYIHRPDTVLGVGGPTVVNGIVTGGMATLVATSQLSPGSGTNSFAALMLHELGHAVNLGHSTDPGDTMYPELLPGRPAGWGPGDRAALATLGAGCPTMPVASLAPAVAAVP